MTAVERLESFYAERERSRAEVCECGHIRLDHFERCGSCLDCQCHSFSKPRDAANTERQ